MKKFLTLFFLLCSAAVFALTSPSYINIKDQPIVDIRSFGAVSGSDCTSAIQAAAASYPAATLFIPAGTWKMCATLSAYISLAGVGKSSIIQANTDGQAAITFNGKIDWRYNRISDLVIDGNSKASNGVTWSSSGRTIFDNVAFQFCDKGINKVSAIGVDVRTCQFNTNNYGIYSYGSVSQHAGNLYINESHFSYNASASVYIHDAYAEPGQISITNCIFERDYGHNICSTKFLASLKAPLKIDSCWFENAPGAMWSTTSQVNTDGTVATAANIMLWDTQATINNCVFSRLDLKSSDVTFNNCGLTLGTNAYSYFVDGLHNSIVWNNRIPCLNATTYGITSINTGLVTTFSGSGGYNASGSSVPSYLNMFLLPPRSGVTYSSTNVYRSFSCASSGVYVDNHAAVVATATDGRLFSQCRTFVGSTTNDVILDWVGGTNLPLDSYKFYAWTFDLKRNNTESEDAHGALCLGDAPGSTVPITGLISGRWYTVGGIFHTDYLPASSFLRIIMRSHASVVGNYNVSAYQILGFDTFPEAQTYLNSGLYARSADGM